MTDEFLSMLRDRLARIEQQNDTQTQLLRQHVKETDQIRKIVDRHSVYFKIATLGIPILSAYLARKLGLGN